MKNRTEWDGTGKVYRFTLRQMFHNKSYVGTLIVLAVMMLLSVPLMVLVMGGGLQVTSKAELKCVYVANETEVPFDLASLSEQNHWFSGTEFEEAEFAPEDWAERIGDQEAFVRIAREDGAYQIELKLRSDDVLRASERSELLNLFEDAFREARYAARQIGSEQLGVLSKQLSTQVRTVASYEDARTVPWEVQYGTQLVYAILVMMCSIYTVTYIIQTLAEEKSSKLVEFLLVSVRPQALVVGKILACMTYVASMIGIMLVSFGISYFVSGMFLDVSVVGQALSASGLGSAVQQIRPALVAVVLFSLLIGYASFAMLAGIFGSACSSIQDVQKATMVPMLIIMAGYIVSCMGTAATSRTVSTVLSLVPGISVYCAPVEFMMGNISLAVLLLSWGIQLAILALLIWLGGRLYNELIMYRGGRVGMREMIRIAGRHSKEGGADR